MVRQKPIVSIDLSETVKSAKNHIGKDWPHAVVESFSEIAASGNDAARKETRSAFELRSEQYILNGIRHYPQTAAQKAISERGLQRHGDMEAAIYLRPSRTPEKSLQFLADHAEGANRNPQEQWIAAPTRAFKQYSLRTGKGRIKKRYKPAELLKRFKASGSVYDKKSGTTISHKRLRRKGRLPGVPFLIYSSDKNKTFIARRFTKPAVGAKRDTGLQFMYVFLTKAYIKKHYKFEEAIWRDVTINYAAILQKHSKRMPNYGGKL